MHGKPQLLRLAERPVRTLQPCCDSVSGPRQFPIWMTLWPSLVWQLSSASDRKRQHDTVGTALVTARPDFGGRLQLIPGRHKPLPQVCAKWEWKSLHLITPVDSIVPFSALDIFTCLNSVTASFGALRRPFLRVQGSTPGDVCLVVPRLHHPYSAPFLLHAVLWTQASISLDYFGYPRQCYPFSMTILTRRCFQHFKVWPFHHFLLPSDSPPTLSYDAP